MTDPAILPDQNYPHTTPQNTTTNTNQLKQTLHALDALNAQLGIIGALVVEQYQLQKQLATMQNPPAYPQVPALNHQYAPPIPVPYPSTSQHPYAPNYPYPPQPASPNPNNNS